MPQTDVVAKLDKPPINKEPTPQRSLLCGLDSLFRTLLPTSPSSSSESRAFHNVTKTTNFPFLALPRELREMVYDYLRGTTNSTSWLDINGFAYERNIPIHQMGPASGFLAYHGIEPPYALSLTCKQLYAELWDHTFEVGPLTPHSDEWRFDPTYQKLAKSVRLPQVRQILIKIQLVRLQVVTNVYGGISYIPIELEECISKVQILAEMLVRVLRRRGKSLKSVLIDWTDEFAEEGEKSWELKSSVLLPFGTLERVQLSLKKLEVDKGAKAEAQKLVEETLDGLSAM